jgi:undecaprenyl pyrophosphate phosphatase UppP
VRLSGVLWLEFTGVFFGIFALYAGSGAWKLRHDLLERPGNHDAHVHFLMAAVMAVVFSYFCVSSFLRARRRGRAR